MPEDLLTEAMMMLEELEEPKPLKLEIGKTYRDGWGREHKVMGLAIRDRMGEERPESYYKDTYWCDTGQWFRKDGRARDGYGVISVPTNYDLKEEVSRGQHGE